MNLTNYRSEIAGVLGLDVNTAAELALIDAFVNEGVAQVLTQTACRVRPFTMTLTANEGDYTLSTSVLSIVEFSVTTSSETFALERVTPAELLALRRNESLDTDSPRKYALSGSDLLMVWPTPDTADTLTGIYVPRPATLTSGTDTPSEIPAEWHRTVSYYALFRLADMDDDASSQMGERYRQLFEMDVAKIRAANLRHGGHRMAPARVNRRRRVLSPRSPSASDW